MGADGIQDFYLQDDLGSPVNLVNQDGQSIERYAYDEFGMPCVYRRIRYLDYLPEVPSHLDLMDIKMDEAGGLYFAQARRYDAGVGRFISEDSHKRTHRSAIHDEPLQLLLQQTDGYGGSEWHVAKRQL